MQLNQKIKPVRHDTTSLAKDLFLIAKESAEIANNVIDDLCHERTEAIISLAVLNDFPKELLSRAFLINFSKDQLLSMPKPLGRDGLLQSWFREQEATGKLKEGVKIVIDEQEFIVDTFLDLRSTKLPSIYLGKYESACWGVGHIATMLGEYVIDPAIDAGPITIEDWQQMMGVKEVVLLKSQLGSLPELDMTYSTEESINFIYDRVIDFLDMQELKKDLNISVENKIKFIVNFYNELTDEEKYKFFNLLFLDQINNKDILKAQDWTELGPNPPRGRFNGDDFSSDDSNRIRQMLKSSTWQERYEAAVEILKPFRQFERLINGAEFQWKSD